MSGGTAGHGQNQKMGETERRRTALRASASAGLQRKRPEEAGRAPPGLQGQTVQNGNPAAGRGFGSKVRSEAVKTRRGLPGRGWGRSGGFVAKPSRSGVRLDGSGADYKAAKPSGRAAGAPGQRVWRKSGRGGGGFRLFGSRDGKHQEAAGARGRSRASADGADSGSF